MIRRCRIPIVAVFRVLQPNSDRIVFGLERLQEPEQPATLVERRKDRDGRFNKVLRSNGPVRRDSLDEDYCKGKYGTGGTFYDGTVATRCSDLTKYDANERFWTLIRPKNGTFYDQNSALNRCSCLPACPCAWLRPTQNTSPAQRSGAERSPARSADAASNPATPA
jgi:hypothetical protein